MIRGLGIDLADIGRIERSWERFGIRFARHILHPEELDELSGNTAPARFLAARFAVKEAAAKALGTGFADGVIPQDIQVVKDASGKPELLFHGRARECQIRMGSARAHLSLSHEKNAAIAVVILEE